MLFSIGADERAALQFDDLASAIDAGLPIAGLGADVAAGERALHSAVTGRGIALTVIEDAVLSAGVRKRKRGQAENAGARMPKVTRAAQKLHRPPSVGVQASHGEARVEEEHAPHH